MEGLKFETELNSQKLKELWNDFLKRKYNGKKIPKKVNDSDWDEFIKETESEIKQSVVDKLYPELTQKQKEEVKANIIIKFERVEKDYLTGG